MNVDFVTLKLFIAVFEEASIVKAADREGIAASALSKRLSDLEASLKLVLFHRHRKGLEPTAAAHTLLGHARTVMRNLAQMETEIGEHQRGVRGKIRIHSNVWAILQYLPDDLTSFLALHPMVHVEVEESVTPATIQAVETNMTDVGIIGSNVPAPGLVVLPYRCDRLVAVVPQDHPLAQRPHLQLVDLLPHHLIGSKRGSSLDELVQHALAEMQDVPTPRVRVTGFETVCRMVEARLGVGLVPQCCAARYDAAMRITTVPLDEPWAVRRLNLCVATGSLPPPTRLLVQHLSQTSADSIANHDAFLRNDDDGTYGPHDMKFHEGG